MAKNDFRRPTSNTVTALAECTRADAGTRNFPKQAALLEVANLIHSIIGQARKGDHDCGYFLGELAPILEKQRSKLNRSNETFRKAFSQFSSARLSTTKQSTLRAQIHRVITDARTRRRELQLSPKLRKSITKNDKQLLDLPELDTSDGSVERWTNTIVYPALRKIGSELPREIKELPKATDKNGKFQISLLRPLIRKTVARIAAGPRKYYSNID